MSWRCVAIGAVLRDSSVVIADAKSDYEILFGEEAKTVQAMVRIYGEAG